jgi:hypothetical protein
VGNCSRSLNITPITDTMTTIAMAMMVEAATVITAGIVLNDYGPGKRPCGRFLSADW